MDEDTRECCETYPGTEHDEHCPSPLWPNQDGAPEQFSLEIHADRSVSVLDGETRIEHYRGADALADALDRRMKLARAAEAGIELTPAKFLAEMLPAYARTQRLEAMLAEVRTAEASALAGLTEAITLLNRAVSLRERLEKALEAASRPLSATEKPEQAAGVRRDTPYFGRLRGEAARLRLVVEDSNPGSDPETVRQSRPYWWTDHSRYKPQPY